MIHEAQLWMTEEEIKSELDHLVKHPNVLWDMRAVRILEDWIAMKVDNDRSRQMLEQAEKDLDNIRGTADHFMNKSIQLETELARVKEERGVARAQLKKVVDWGKDALKSMESSRAIMDATRAQLDEARNERDTAVGYGDFRARQVIEARKWAIYFKRQRDHEHDEVSLWVEKYRRAMRVITEFYQDLSFVTDPQGAGRRMLQDILNRIER